ncbi:MAG: HNH endonuclease [Gammaproteobacteria bacterium]|nr:HNH endonuclease [Gammaproteobacteria bacterium]
MRPVDKGDTPQQQYTNYQNARPELLERMGQYCSYCEVIIPAYLAVEHVRPKREHPELELDWHNFLLACGNCNPIKGRTNVKLTDYYWPHLDNTFRAFLYKAGGLVKVNDALNASERAKAQNTLNLTGLQKKAGNEYTASDRRWVNRRDAWKKAQRAKQRLANNDTEEMREEIAEHAHSKGFWSVWMTVFQQDSDMLNRFIRMFPGTCLSCFDREGWPVPRPGGTL